MVVERYSYGLYGDPDTQAFVDTARTNLLVSQDAIDEHAQVFGACIDYVGTDGLRGDLRADVDGDGIISSWDQLRFAQQQTAWTLINIDQIAANSDEAIDGWSTVGQLSRPHPVGMKPTGEPLDAGTVSQPGARDLHRLRGVVQLDNRLGYAGYVWDPFLQMYHVRHRVLNPRLGIWMQPDPIGYAGGWNLHEYCGGDPLRFVDPSGLIFGDLWHYTKMGIDELISPETVLGTVASTTVKFGAMTIASGIGMTVLFVASPTAFVVGAVGLTAYGAYSLGGAVFEAATGTRSEGDGYFRDLNALEWAESVTNSVLGIATMGIGFKIGLSRPSPTIKNLISGGGQPKLPYRQAVANRAWAVWNSIRAFFGLNTESTPSSSASVNQSSNTKGACSPNIYKRPNRSRHEYSNLRTIHRARVQSTNSVLHPEVDVDADIAAINSGLATRSGNTFTINGRNYGIKSDGKSLYPIDGHGVYKLDREAYKALLIMKELGDPQLPTVQEAFNQNRLSPGSVNDAINAWRSINNALGPTPP